MKEFLIQKRKTKQLTHEQVATESDITRQYYGMIESGEKTPSVAVAKRIAAVLDFDWTLFFDSERNLKLPLVK